MYYVVVNSNFLSDFLIARNCILCNGSLSEFWERSLIFFATYYTKKGNLYAVSYLYPREPYAEKR